MKKGFRRGGGFIKTVIFIVIGLVVLGYFGFKLEDILKLEAVEKNLEFVWKGVAVVWNKFLKTPALFIWHRVVIDLFWENFQRIFDRGASGL